MNLAYALYPPKFNFRALTLTTWKIRACRIQLASDQSDIPTARCLVPPSIGSRSPGHYQFPKILESRAEGSLSDEFLSRFEVLATLLITYTTGNATLFLSGSSQSPWFFATREAYDRNATWRRRAPVKADPHVGARHEHRTGGHKLLKVTDVEVMVHLSNASIGDVRQKRK
jgi:hypothetical protein